MGKPRSVPKIERKIIEKNRRIRMKTLYSDLISLLPNHSSKVEELPLPDQLDEAVEHIKSMQKKVEKLRQKKDELMLGQGIKRASDQSCVVDSSENQASKKRLSSPIIEVHDMGPNLDVVFANGIQDYSTFHDIIKLIHDQNGVEIASASFGRDGSSTIQVLQDKVGQSKLDLEGATMSRKQKELVCGSTSSSRSEVLVESNQFNLWDYEIGSDIWDWGFEMPHVLPAETHFGYYDQFPNMTNFNM